MEEIDKIRESINVVDKDLMELSWLTSLLPIREDFESLDEIWKNMMEQKDQLVMKLDYIEKKYRKKDDIIDNFDTFIHLDNDDMYLLCGYQHSEGKGCILTILRADITCPKCKDILDRQIEKIKKYNRFQLDEMQKDWEEEAVKMMQPDCESGDNKQISEQEAIEILNRMREKITAPYVRAALRIGIENIKEIKNK